MPRAIRPTDILGRSSRKDGRELRVSFARRRSSTASSPWPLARATRPQDALHRQSKVEQDPPQVVDDLFLRAIHRGERLPGGGHVLGPPWVVPEVADAGGQGS